jgi:hypothetical protein
MYIHLWSTLSLAMMVPYTLMGKPLSKEAILTESMFAESSRFMPRMYPLLVNRIGGISAASDRFF